MNESQATSIHRLLEGYSKLSYEDKIKRLLQVGVIEQDDLDILAKKTALDFELSNQFIENAIGSFPMPLGLAMNFVINDKDYIIPMALEETSVIAAASKTAKWIRETGKIESYTKGKCGLGQLLFSKVKHYDHFKEKILTKQKRLIDIVNANVTKNLVARGGGVRDITIRRIERPDDKIMAVVHIMVDTCDAMGANIITQVCEFLKPYLEELTLEKCNMCILSNVPDTKLTRVKVTIPNIDQELGELIEEASLFAQLDPYRAATNNKGVMNGMDPVLIATGNDWRAVESGIHAYAALNHQYTSITRWSVVNGDLIGVLEAPITVGIVGGVTRLHPVAKICLKLMAIESAEELAEVVAAVGLVQNLAAIKALVTHGIASGHMKLHAANLAMMSGATKQELPHVKELLMQRLAVKNRITGQDAAEILTDLRKLKK